MYWDQDRQGADLVVEAPKHDHLINWPTWGHVTVWEICISIFMTFIANKLGRLLTLGRIFSMQTHHRLLVLVFFHCWFSFLLERFILFYNSISPMLTLERKFLFRFTCAKNACKIKEFWPHSSQLAELYYILLVC